MGHTIISQTMPWGGGRRFLRFPMLLGTAAITANVGAPIMHPRSLLRHAVRERMLLPGAAIEAVHLQRNLSQMEVVSTSIQRMNVRRVFRIRFRSREWREMGALPTGSLCGKGPCRFWGGCGLAGFGRADVRGGHSLRKVAELEDPQPDSRGPLHLPDSAHSFRRSCARSTPSRLLMARWTTVL